MQVENHKEEVPFEYYLGLFEKLDPAEAMERLPGCQWDGKAFTLTLLGKTYRISWPAYECLPCHPEEPEATKDPLPNEDGDSSLTLRMTPTLQVQTFLLRYLLESREVAWKGTWKTFREMPWGEMYIKPYTGRVLTRAAFTFGTRVEKFRAACEKMGATKLQHGDASYQFDFIGGYAMQIMVWEGDEEFPPNAQVLYSDNFETGFAAEDRVVAGDILISAIKGNM